MWNNISSLVLKGAEKAKDAAALIEEQINHSIGAEVEEGGAGADAVGEGPARGSDGWEKCDLSSNGSDSKDEEDSKNITKEISYVNLKSVDDQEQNSGAPEANDTATLLTRIESLEKQVSSLKVELASVNNKAREDSENYHATNLLLEQQIKELQEENTSLKERKLPES